MELGSRRLAAIVVADVVGFSRMMAEDEDATLSALRAHRNVVDPIILNHGGRLVKSTGDGFLLEFPSAVSALEASVEVQRLMAERNESVSQSRRMQFRVGINLGDVVIDESGDVFGDGVNVAARIEPLAEPGGIALSDAVASAVRGKLTTKQLVDHGSHDLKNIPDPVRVWRISGEEAPSDHPHSVTTARKLATVAILPFDNLSGDPDQEYFADGITEDLITALSRDRELAVIARNSTFAFKDSPTDIRNIARELDSTHVVEGSVRKSGSRVRITAQLIDAETGHHLWAERYDRDLDDIFEVQDEVVEAIVSRLRPTLWDSVRSRSGRSSGSVDAWDLTMQGLFHANANTVDGLSRAIEFYDRARDLDPEFVPAVSRAAAAWFLLAMFGWRGSEVHPLERGREDLRIALSLEPDDFLSRCMEAAIAGIDGRPLEGAASARRAISVNRYVSLGYHMLGTNLDKSGDQEAAIDSLTEAWRLGTHEPMAYDIASDLGYAHYMAARYEAAYRWGTQSIRLVDGFLQSRVLMAATCARLGRVEEASEHAERVLGVRPEFSCGRHESRLGYLVGEHSEALTAGLRLAGLPE